MAGITIAYSGVHQIYQIALAAQELGALDYFFCSLIDAPGKWGNLFAKVFGSDRLINRHRPEIDPHLVEEYPWPLAYQFLQQQRKKTLGAADWEKTNNAFDHWAAKQLQKTKSRLFVGGENCALASLKTARQKGMKTLLDCHQVYPNFLEKILAEAAEDLKLPAPEPFDTPTWREQKLQEYNLADIILVISEAQKQSFLANHFPVSKLFSITLWADTNLFYSSPIPLPKNKDKLQVLFVGALSLRKGIPYLLQAIELCGAEIELTLIGTKTSEINPYLSKYEGNFKYISTMTKANLRQYYWQSDVLVLPSLVDTFGWVAMEAMACGLPVIVSDNCGVPVPDESWRVPVMNSQAIAEKLLMLKNHREYCTSLGEIAANFASQFTAERYRQQLQILMQQMLN